LYAFRVNVAVMKILDVHYEFVVILNSYP